MSHMPMLVLTYKHEACVLYMQCVPEVNLWSSSSLEPFSPLPCLSTEPSAGLGHSGARALAIDQLLSAHN